MMMCMGLASLGVAEAQVQLTLDKAIEIALNDNPTVKVADMEIERYDYVYKQAASTLYPQIEASGQYALAIRRQEMTEGFSFGYVLIQLLHDKDHIYYQRLILVMVN